MSIRTLDEGIAACRTGGFDCLAMSPGLFAEMDIEEAKEAMFEAHVAPGSWGVPFNWRASQEEFETGLHAMADHDMVFGLEFVGPRSLRARFKHPFYYSLMPMYEFAQSVGPNVGLLVDAWHMMTSESSYEDLATIPAEKIALVHINDAPPNLTLDEYLDHERCLPCATGVIDIAGLMNTLRTIGYIGPVEAEPFDVTLKDLESDGERLTKVGRSMQAAFSAK